MKIMKVCDFPYDHEGGINIILSKLSTHLRHYGHQVSEVYINDNRRKTVHLEDDTWEIPLGPLKTTAKVPTLDTIMTFFPSYLRLIKLFRKIRPDVVHFHGISMLSIYFASLCKISGIKFVYTFQNEPPSFNTKSKRFIFSIILYWTDIVTAVSKSTLKSISLSTSVLYKSAVIPNGIDFHYWSKNVEPMNHKDKKLIVHVGRLCNQKGQDVLLQSFASLLEQNVGSRLILILIGNGAWRQYLHNLAHNLNIRDKVKFTGWLDPSEVKNLLNAAAIFAFPSRYEGCPMALIEAMAVGVPVVASSVGGIPEIVSDGELGFLVPPDDEKELFSSLSTLLNDSSIRKKFSANGQKRARSFEWKNIARRYLEIYSPDQLNK